MRSAHFRCQRCPRGGCGGAWFEALCVHYRSQMRRYTACQRWASICVTSRCPFFSDCLSLASGKLPCTSRDFYLPPLPSPGSHVSSGAEGASDVV